LALASPVLAQDEAAQPEAAQPAQDPPDRAARLSYLDGAVSLQPAGVQDWNAAPLNQPLTTGDTLWSDSGSHAELDLGSAVVRLDQNSSLAVLDLSDQSVQLRLSSGSVDISVGNLDAAGVFEVDAPNAAVALLRPGEYRFTVDNAGNTSVAVHFGQAQVISGDDQNMTLATGQRGLYGAGGSYALTTAAPPDDFDRWCQQRQARRADEQAQAQYVSSEVVGYQDLEDYGQWQQQPDYGYVWFPTQVDADWAPYNAGHWAWVAPWGWSWVDDAPWGFAPFHYGRWLYTGRRWGWVPAPPHRHAVYAPALVAWVGGPGTGVALSLGGGAAVGWLPLAPGEVYVPGYGVSARYLQNVNLSNSSSLTATTVSNVWRNPTQQYRYANRAAPRALTVVPQINFTAGQPVARHVIAPPPQFLSATPAARVPGIAPARESILGPVSLARVARPSPNVIDRAVLMHRLPPPSPASERTQPLIATPARTVPRARPAPAAGPGAAPAVTPTPYRGIPERSPQFQAPTPSAEPNVFKRRDEELQAQHDAELREQQAQQLLQQQQRQRQQVQQQQRQVQTPPQAQRQEQQPPAVTPQHPKPDTRRPSEPIPPSEQR
jgi:FecR protein